MPNWNVALPNPTSGSFSSANTAQQFSEVRSIECIDAIEILNWLANFKYQCELKNIKLEAVMVGTVEYYSLSAWTNNTAYMTGMGDRGGELYILDIKIIHDPIRDTGPRIPIFNRNEALKILAIRGRQA